MSPRAAVRLETLGFSQVFDYAAGKMDWAAMGLPLEGKAAATPRAGDLARRDVPTCRLEDRLADVQARVQEAGWEMCVVTDETGVVLGRMRKRALAQNPDAIVEEIMEEGPTTIRPNTELEGITRRMQARKVGSILVTKLDGRLVGVLFRQDAEGQLG
ncbi:MAG TPA: CBS domain-containing protein [Anaerolineales bacterium]|nr:CBS domain-containing protein [Anaerolineales bacterium]